MAGTRGEGMEGRVDLGDSIIPAARRTRDRFDGKSDALTAAPSRHNLWCQFTLQEAKKE